MADLLPWFSSTIWPWIILFVHGLLITVASAHVVLTKRDSRSAIGWVGIIWLAPIVGTLLYFTFGINRIQRKARYLRAGQQQIDSSAGRHATEKAELCQMLGEDNAHLCQLVHYVSQLTHLPLVPGNSTTGIIEKWQR